MRVGAVAGLGAAATRAAAALDGVLDVGRRAAASSTSATAWPSAWARLAVRHG